MDTSSLDKPPSESKECLANNSGTGKLVTPQKHVADITVNLCTPDTFKSPLDFSTVTVEQLGITPESFVKTSSGKSPSSLQKARRRSTVGVRGSPETNCLIRFIAQQRNLKNSARFPLSHNSPFQGSPGLHQNASTLRERMAAFQSAFHSIQETKKMARAPGATKADGESKTSDWTTKEGLVEYQQSGFPVNSSSKRRRISSQDSLDCHLSGTKREVVPAQVFADQACAGGASIDLAEKSSDSGSAQPECMVAPFPELMEASHGLGVAYCVEGTRSVGAAPLDTPAAHLSSCTPAGTRSPVTPVCKSSSPTAKNFVLRSVLKKSGKLFSENRKECNICDDRPHLIPDPSNYFKEKRAGRENCKTPDCLNLKKRKKVTFGEDLSPEVFDDSLPANTPLCKGETPARQKNMDTNSPLQSPVHEQLLQPNFDDNEENLENIEPPQVPLAILSPSKSLFSETLPGTDTCSSSNNHKGINCSIGKPTRISYRRKQLLSSAEEDVCNSHATKAEPCKEKNMNRRKSEETKCTREAPPQKKQVSKSYRKKKRKGKKGVEKSLYGQRDIASRKPLLSPIPELPEVCEVMADCTQQAHSDDSNVSGEPEEVISLEIPVKRKRLSPQKEYLSELDPAFDQSHVSGLCCYLLPFTAASEGGPHASTRDTGQDSNTRAESKHKSAKEPKSGVKTNSSLVPCASVTQGHIVSNNPKPLCTPQCQEFFKAGESAENPCEILTVSKNMNIKCEEESECLAPKGSVQCNPSRCDPEREHNGSENVLVENIKESTSQSENVGRKCAQTRSVLSGRRQRKWRRLTLHCCEAEGSSLEQNRSPASSHSAGTSVRISLENSQLIEDLSDTLEQSFQRASQRAKVRRSTRLQRDLENTGLTWLSPSPPTLRKTRRMTICIFDRKGFETTSSKEETVSSGENPGALPSVSDSESHDVGSSMVPGKRRKSFCVSTLKNAESTTQPPCLKRRSSLKKRESSQLP